MQSNDFLIERAILDDLRQRCGLSFSSIASIGTQRDRAVAEAVLPVLEQWLPYMTGSDYRRVFFYQFVTRYATPFLASLLTWWKEENDKHCTDILTQAIANAVDSKHAETVWRQIRRTPPVSYQFLLWSKLARFQHIAREVTDALVEALEAGHVPKWEIGDVAQVDDARIRRWFESRVDSPDKMVRQIARRVAARGAKLPPNVKESPHPPDRKLEEFSAEVDLADLGKTLGSAAKNFGLKIPPKIRSGSFLSSVGIDQWVRRDIRAASGEPYELWLRLEDFDVVEFVIAHAQDYPPDTIQ